MASKAENGKTNKKTQVDYGGSQIKLWLGMATRALGLSVVHPGGDPVPAEARRKPQAGRAHGEVADEVPDEADHLHHCGDKREDRGVELQACVTRVSDGKVFGKDGKEEIADAWRNRSTLRAGRGVQSKGPGCERGRQLTWMEK